MRKKYFVEYHGQRPSGELYYVSLDQVTPDFISDPPCTESETVIVRNNRGRVLAEFWF